MLSGLADLSYGNISSKFINAGADLAKIKLLFDDLQELLNENLLVFKNKYRDFVNGFYGHLNEKDFEWHKMALAYQYALYLDKAGKEGESIKMLKEALIYSLDNLFEKSLINKSSDTDLCQKRECPICGQIINKTLESKMFHFICPKCKSHILIDNDNGSVLIDISQSRNKRYREQQEIVRLREMEKEYNLVREKLFFIEKKWWYKLYKKYICRSNLK